MLYLDSAEKGIIAGRTRQSSDGSDTDSFTAISLSYLMEGWFL